ncbi:hypothetical protein PDIDSM_4348 [Penicillium digitatum]|nr:hypothetical protein PDIDSM_4348 [Penicillium digitatum]
MAPIDLASARGTKLSDIVIDRRPSTGRGKKLTSAQEGTLKKLYEQELPSVSNGELPAKGFWSIASLFCEQTGREYSWLSVKRRAAGWRQKSVGIDRRRYSFRASELGAEDSVPEPSQQDVACQSSRQEGTCDSKLSKAPQKIPSPFPQDLNKPELSQLDRSADVGDWSQRSWVSGDPDPSQDTSRNLKPPRISQPSPRSSPPLRVSQPRYRHRSPSPKRPTKTISNRLHHQLASFSDGKVVSSLNPLPVASPAREYLQASHPGKTIPAESNRARKLTEKDEPENHARDSARSKRGGLLVPAHFSEQDDLPLAPTQIKRRHVAR